MVRSSRLTINVYNSGGYYNKWFQSVNIYRGL